MRFLMQSINGSSEAAEYLRYNGQASSSQAARTDADSVLKHNSESEAIACGQANSLL